MRLLNPFLFRLDYNHEDPFWSLSKQYSTELIYCANSAFEGVEYPVRRQTKDAVIVLINDHMLEQRRR